MSSETDTSRTVVQTYVPKYQKEEWKRHADDLGMTQSEFVRSMVQAGRAGFDPGDSDGTGPEASRTPEEGGSADATPGGDVRDHVLTALAEEAYRSWDDLAEAVTAHVERELEATLEDLQAENAIRYSGPKGGYTLVEDP